MSVSPLVGFFATKSVFGWKLDPHRREPFERLFAALVLADCETLAPPAPQSSLRPIRQDQPGNALELATVRRHQRCAAPAGGAGDEDVVGADPGTRAPQMSTDRARLCGVGYVERDDVEALVDKRVQHARIAFRAVAVCDAVAQLESGIVESERRAPTRRASS